MEGGRGSEGLLLEEGSFGAGVRISVTLSVMVLAFSGETA